MNKKNITISIILTAILSILSLTLVAFKTYKNITPNDAFIVYLDGKKIGLVKSKKDLEEYINLQEEKLKKKYQVEKIYTPKGVEIKKITTYRNDFKTNEEIYNNLLKNKNFTIKGIVVEIKKKTEENYDYDNIDSSKKNEKEIINVLNKKIFDESVIDVVKAFIPEEEYNKFMESAQEPIENLGSIIEDIYIEDDITYREDYISTDEKIYQSTDELTKYLLYGTNDEQEIYIVKEGDTIASIAESNKLNVKEFLIANPIFTSENNLLYTNQKVVVGLVNPIIDVIVEKHSIEEEVSKFNTEIKYDDELVVGYSYVEREGENGLDKVTRKYQYKNGQLSDVAMLGSVEIKPSVSKILVKGDKYIPNVADLSYWGWPTQKPYTLTSLYEYRWGSFHNAIDIFVGHGSNIYAANNGTVHAVGTGCIRGDVRCNGGKGNYVIINHNIKNYYTQYMHLATVNVKPGQTVSRGQKIGTMGNTGNCIPTPAYGSNSLVGTHLHFEVWIGQPHIGYHINPLRLY